MGMNGMTNNGAKMSSMGIQSFNHSGQITGNVAGNGNHQNNQLAAAAMANGAQPYMQWSNAYTGINLSRFIATNSIE